MQPATSLSAWQKAAGYGSLLTAAVLAAALAGYPAMFSALTSVDEGGFLLYIQQTVAGMPLYDVVFTQYGPAYFVLMNAFFGLPGIEVTHDTGRLVTLTFWTGASLLCGASLLRLTSSIPVALAGLLVAFYALSSMVYEPMHVGGTIAILLAGIIAAAAFLLPARPRTTLFVMGGLAVTVALIKANVGAFAIVAIAFACATAMSPPGNAARLRVAATAVVAALPFALMHDGLGEGWVVGYAATVALGAFAVAAASARLPGGWPPRPPWSFALGGTAAAAVVLAVVTIQGTTPGGLVEGIVTRPLRHADLFLTEIDLPALGFIAPLAGLAAAIYVGRRERGSVPWLAASLRIAAGVAIWFAVARVGGAIPADSAFLHDYHSDSIVIVASLAWVAAIPARRDRVEPSEAFIRALLPMLAVLQLLHAYPIPGTQIAWGVFPAAVVGGMCVADGLRGLEPYLSSWNLRPLGQIAVLTAAAVFVAGWGVDWARSVRDDYAAESSLALSGAQRLRLPDQQAADLRALTTELRRSCSSFLTLPGFESLYLLSDMDAPTTSNGGVWPIIFDSEEQAEVLEDVRTRPRLCAVRDQSAADFIFSLGPDYVQRPLVRFIQEDFTVTDAFGPFELMRRDVEEG